MPAPSSSSRAARRASAAPGTRAPLDSHASRAAASACVLPAPPADDDRDAGAVLGEPAHHLNLLVGQGGPAPQRTLDRVWPGDAQAGFLTRRCVFKDPPLEPQQLPRRVPLRSAAANRYHAGARSRVDVGAQRDRRDRRRPIAGAAGVQPQAGGHRGRARAPRRFGRGKDYRVRPEQLQPEWREPARNLGLAPELVRALGGRVRSGPRDERVVEQSSSSSPRRTALPATVRPTPVATCCRS